MVLHAPQNGEPWSPYPVSFHTAFRSWEALSEERSEAAPTVQVVHARVMSRRRCLSRLSKFDQRAPIPTALF